MATLFMSSLSRQLPLVSSLSSLTSRNASTMMTKQLIPKLNAGTATSLRRMLSSSIRIDNRSIRQNQQHGGMQWIQKSTTILSLRNSNYCGMLQRRVSRYYSTTPKNCSNSNIGNNNNTWLARFMGPKEMPERRTFAWYCEMILICTVFGITGSSTMLLVRPAVSNVLGIRGTLKDGPWSYRICSIVIMTPIYATLLIVVGTVFGRHAYFKHFAVKIFSRFGIPPEFIDPSYHITKATFKKW